MSTIFNEKKLLLQRRDRIHLKSVSFPPNMFHRKTPDNSVV
jgi:hypothetical protein